jgi:hypothetical protein
LRSSLVEFALLRPLKRVWLLLLLLLLQAPGLPKTRSGKIMRRVLRKIAADQLDELGDTSTLAEPQVVDQLIASRPKTLAKL